MKTLAVTVIGQDLHKIVKEKLELAGINTVNQINSGMLGNLKLLTYLFELEDEDVISVRSKILRSIGEEPLRMSALFVAGDWMRIIVMKPIKI